MDSIKLKKFVTKSLHNAGFSFREIMKIVGYKSPNSVAYTLKRKYSSAPSKKELDNFKRK